MDAKIIRYVATTSFWDLKAGETYDMAFKSWKGREGLQLSFSDLMGNLVTKLPVWRIKSALAAGDLLVVKAA